MGHIVGQEYTMSSFVISTCYGSKSLLTSSVPNLQLYIVLINFHGFESEVNANSCKVTLLERVIRESS
jgi:hypothetical protein